MQRQHKPNCMNPIPASERFVECLRQAMAAGRLIKVTFSGYAGADAGLRR